MDNSEAAKTVVCEMPKDQSSLLLENNHQIADNSLISNDNPLNSFKNTDQNTNSENQISTEKTDVSSLNAANVAPETSSVVPTDDSLSSLPPLPKNDKDSQPPVPYSADYNAQNYANYNYVYGNYSNYYGYPYPQYQWDYNSQQYYQPYQNYYNYGYNANQTQTSASKPPPPPPDSVQLPVEEKPSNKINTVTGDDSNRYSPTAETDDDDTVKGLPENKLDNITPQPVQTAKQFSNSVPFQTVSPEQAEVQKDSPGSIGSSKNNVNQPSTPLVTPTLQSVSAHLQQLNVPVQSSGYMINPQVQKQTTEVVKELKNQQQNPSILNGKDDSVEKTSKGSTVLGKNQAKKRLMAFSMMKQKLQEQNSSINDNQSSDFVEGNDEFIPELNIFQTVQKKKVVTNKKVTKVIKAQQTIEQIEEMKKDEMMQGNNAALYQHLLRSGGNEAPILQKLGIESLAEKYSAKMKERGKRLKRHHHRHRDDRRGYKYHRHSHPKSRSRSRSAEKPKMRALDVKSWKDFVSGGFQFDKFRRFKLDEAEELKDKERKSRTKKKHGDSQTDGKHQNAECILLTEAQKSNGESKLRYNLLDRKKEILKGLEVVTQEADCTKDFPSYIIRMTKTKPVLKFSHNPAIATYHLQNRQQMLETLLPEIETIVHKFFSSIKPKKLKENSTDFNFNSVDDKLLLMMNNKNVYPFKGWWPKTYFIMTQVKENPNIEVDKDALLNAVPTSKRTKKSRFDDNTSLTDLRPTVPSKWDSDYDDSPVMDKIVDTEVSQNNEMNTNDIAVINNREEIKTLDISHQEEPMDTASDIGDDEPKIEVNIFSNTHTLPQEPQSHAKLDTEYEEFLKIACVEKNDKNNDMPFLKVNENDLSINSVSLNESVQDESEDDTSSKSSDESISLHNAIEESIDQLSFVKSLSSFDKKLKKKKKVSSKKPKKFKKKVSKKKSHNSSSSESSLESESESDSSSEDSESESSDSISTVEKKKKKHVSKDKKKKKGKTKKKHKGDKSKTKKPEDEKDNIINLLQKALNAKIKQRQPESDESKQKKKKRKHEKKMEDNKNTLSCDNSRVCEVLKYLKMDEEKEKKKKLKKNSKRKFDSDDSNNDKSSKKAKLNDSLLSEDSNEKKKKGKKKKLSDKKCDDLDDRVSKKKSKKKSKTSDSSEAENDKESHKKSKKDKDSDYFFGPRPNEWNKNNKSSMRGVVHHSAKITNYSPSTSDVSKCDNEKSKNHKSFCVKNEYVCFSNCDTKNVYNDDSSIKKDKMEGQLNVAKKSIEIIKDNRLSSGREKVKINSKNSRSASGRKYECIFENNENLQKSDLFDNNIIEHEVGILQTSLPTKKYNEQKHLIKDQKNVLKLCQNKSLIQNHNDEPPDIILMPSIPVGQTISHRNRVKMNLKNLLCSSQNIPVEFVCSSLLGSIKPKYFEIEKNEYFELNQKKNQEVDKSEKLDDSIESATLSSPTIYTKSSDSMLPISGMEMNNQVNYRSFNWEDSEDSSSHQSSVKSVKISDHLTNDDEISKLKTPPVLEYMHIKNKQHKFDTLSNDSDVKELWHTFDFSKDNYIGVDSKIKEQECQHNSDVESSVKEEVTSPSNLGFSYATVLENDDESISVALSKKNYCDSLSSQYSSNDSEVYKNDNELITQWTSDWSKLVDESIIKINNSDNCRSDDTKKFLIKKKSRWDEQPKNDEVSDQLSLNNEQIELKDDVSNYTTDSLDTSNSTSNVKNEFLDEQNQQCEITSLNCMSDNVDYDNYSENLSNDNGSYNQYSCKPQYSEMKTLEDSHLSPVDYSIYENYNPNYDYQDEDNDKWKALDISNDLNIIPTTDETQVGNILEKLPSTEGAELLKDEELNDEALNDEKLNDDVLPDVQDVQNEILTHKNSDSFSRKQQFSQLYQQFVTHFSQNAIKYSMSNPFIDIKTKVNFDAAVEESPSQEEKLSDTDQDTDDKKIPLPLRQRAYVCVVEDNNTNVYLTNDNYIAYCAVEDKCLVHIALDVCSLDSVQDQARHCFNINQNGTVVEYWLHADLIPFYNPSEAESGVFSDDENDSTGFGSGQEDHSNENDSAEDNDNSNDTIIGEWEIIDSDSDADSWLNDPSILKKYGEENSINIDGVEQTVTDVNQKEYVANSPEYSSDSNDVSDSDNNKKRSSHLSENQNITQSLIQNIYKNKDNIYETQDFDVPTSAVSVDVLQQTDSTVINSNLPVETHDNLKLSSAVLSDESENYDDLSITSESLISNIKMEDIDNSCKLNKNESEPEIFQKEELKVEELITMNNIINQQMLIQRLKMQSNERTRKKLPDTVMFSYSDNMEIVKHPFLGLFQPPTISVLVKQRKVKVPGILKLIKHVTFADGINPGTVLAESPKHAAEIRPLSPTPLKTLMRESLKLKRNTNPFIKSKKKCTKLSMVCKKVAKVTPSVKSCISPDVEYYVSQHSFEDLAVAETPANNNIEKSEDSPLDSDDDDSGSIKITTPPSPTREVTPVPSDNDCWDEDGINNYESRLNAK